MKKLLSTLLALSILLSLTQITFSETEEIISLPFEESFPEETEQDITASDSAEVEFDIAAPDDAEAGAFCSDSAFPADVAVPKAGNTLASATAINLGDTYSGTLASNNSNDFYSFTLPSSGYIGIKATAYMQWIYYRIYDTAGNSILNYNPNWNSTTQQISTSYGIYLNKGTYIFNVSKDGNHTGSYNFYLDFISINESFTETVWGSNNSLGTASDIELNKTYIGQIGAVDAKDFYKFTLPSSGRVSLSSTARMQWLYYRLYDSAGNQIWSTNPQWNSTTSEILLNANLDLVKGTYYLVMEKDGSHTGKYSFSMPFTSANEYFEETGADNNIHTANPIQLGVAYTGQLAINDATDFYTFTATSDQELTFRLISRCQWMYIRLYDVHGKQLWGANPQWNSVTNEIDYTKKDSVAAGTYCLCVTKDGSRTAPYTVSVSDQNQAVVTPAPTQASTPTPTSSPNPTPSPSATPNPTPSPSATPTPTLPTVTPAVKPTVTPAPAATPIPEKELDATGALGTVKLKAGRKLQLVPLFAENNGWTVKNWKSSNNKIAAVSRTGLVTAKKAGTATITIATKNGKKATVKIRVTAVKPRGVLLNLSGTVRLKKGKSIQLEADLTPAYATSALTWTTSNKKIATVSAKGKVTAKKPGTATITVKTQNGKKAKVKIKVTK